jgi:hypothetical protein
VTKRSPQFPPGSILTRQKSPKKSGGIRRYLDCLHRTHQSSLSSDSENELELLKNNTNLLLNEPEYYAIDRIFKIRSLRAKQKKSLSFLDRQ